MKWRLKVDHETFLHIGDEWEESPEAPPAPSAEPLLKCPACGKDMDATGSCPRGCGTAAEWLERIGNYIEDGTLDRLAPRVGCPFGCPPAPAEPLLDWRLFPRDDTGYPALKAAGTQCGYKVLRIGGQWRALALSSTHLKASVDELGDGPLPLVMQACEAHERIRTPPEDLVVKNAEQMKGLS
jgi:hypothetical protein